MNSKRLLQAVMAVLTLIPLITGSLVLLGVDNPEYRHIQLPRDTLLDSNLRFVGGLWFSFGLVFCWLIPKIDQPWVRPMFAAMGLMLFVGGLGRMASVALLGWPSPPIIGAIALELIGVPLLVWWQRSVSARLA